MFTTINEWKKYLEDFQLVPGLRIVNANLPNTKDYSNIKWNDIKIEELSNDGNNIMHLGIILPGESEPNTGIVFDIQIINDELYHPHTFISNSMQGQGIGYKMLLKFIHEFGHLYATTGRTINKTSVPIILKKLQNESDIEYHKTKTGGDLFILKSNPDKDYLLKKYVNMA